ncbi:MAG TPA: DUF1295 domain-containing protein, partial [Candidatus Acetothermia bacterium]|nr:DUF1295 domain-containing protein [Candidatus Acetothermia bacterium]
MIRLMRPFAAWPQLSEEERGPNKSMEKDARKLAPFMPAVRRSSRRASERAGAIWHHLRLSVKTVLRWLDIVVYLAFLAFVVLLSPRVTPWCVGLCLSAADVPLWFVARWQLGASFSVRPDARQLVTRGLYSKLRHPVYVFGSLAWLGALLVLLGWSALLIRLVVVVIEV